MKLAAVQIKHRPEAKERTKALFPTFIRLTSTRYIVCFNFINETKVNTNRGILNYTRVMYLPIYVNTAKTIANASIAEQSETELDRNEAKYSPC